MTKLLTNMMTRIAAGMVGLVAMTVIVLAGPVNVDGDGLALQGHDPVAYFTQNKPVKGSAEHSAEHDGATYHFASAEHRAMFVANPEKFAPQYGGYCAYGLAKGSKAPVEIDKFTVVDGKLYLNFNGAIQSRWEEDIPGFINQANANWKNIE